MAGFVSRRSLLLSGGAAGLALGFAPAGWAQAADPFDALKPKVDRFLAEFGTPGVALAVVRKDGADWLGTFGRQALSRRQPVDANTLFAVASNTKSMTAAGLAILVDQGKLAWDDPVTKHLPDFAMADEVTTKLMTVRDLLTHRSGLPLGAGDLMIWPTTTHTREEVVRGLRYLKPVRGFRVGYDYDNVLYIAAGALIEKLTGQTWEAWITANVLRPAGMATAVPAPSLVKTPNLAGRHARIGGPIYGIGPMKQVERQETDSFAPAGGVQASIRDMAAWVRTQLNSGKGPDGRQIWKPERQAEMWAPQTIIASTGGPTPEEPARAIFNTYALGWQVFDYRGEKVVGHSGGMNGQITYTAMIPGRGVGLVVLTNAEERGVMIGLRNVLLDRLMDAPAFDWLGYWKRAVEKQNREALAELEASAPKPGAGGPSLPLGGYAGLYRDPWYGDLKVSVEGGKLRVDFLKTKGFRGDLEPWGPDTFRTRFNDPTIEEAVLTFKVEGGRVVLVTARALSPLADFSYDFHHLEFRPVNP